MTDTLADLTSALQTYVVSPLNSFGLGGLVFDVAGEERAILASDITDHYTESNKALQDHIAIKPKRITLKGYVGELVYTAPGNSGNSILQTVTQNLTTISAFLPTLSAGALQAQTAIAGVNSSTIPQPAFSQVLPASANIYGLVQSALGATGNTAKQQNAYSYFAACQSQGILMGIQTPWEFLTNMAIEMIEAIQTEDSIFITDFSITFKQIRIAATSTITAASVLSGTGAVPQAGAGPIAQYVAATQGAATTNLGINPGAVVNSSPLPVAGIPSSFILSGN